ncbi:Uncharacterised protein [Candidatus Gugararchaeum adminiculabundum]|nr:Uncharacterised protein [Candidatus Gugararchaeum adminiculabundum]
MAFLTNSPKRDDANLRAEQIKRAVPAHFFGSVYHYRLAGAGYHCGFDTNVPPEKASEAVKIFASLKEKYGAQGSVADIPPDIQAGNELGLNELILRYRREDYEHVVTNLLIELQKPENRQMRTFVVGCARFNKVFPEISLDQIVVYKGKEYIEGEHELIDSIGAALKWRDEITLGTLMEFIEMDPAERDRIAAILIGQINKPAQYRGSYDALLERIRPIFEAYSDILVKDQPNSSPNTGVPK